MAPASTHAQNRPDPAPAPRPQRYVPRSLSIHSKWRFARRRRAEYLDQIVGAPTPWQIAAIESLIRREWLTRTAEDIGDLDGTIRADREYQKLLDAFRRSLAPAAAPQPTLAEAIAAYRAEQGHAA
jgi:hypothetical protein